MLDVLSYLLKMFSVFIIIGYWIADICFWNKWKIGWGKLVFGIFCFFLPDIVGLDIGITARSIMIFLGSAYVTSSYFTKMDKE